MTPADVLRSHRALDDVRGWLAPVDAQVFALLLRIQAGSCVTGDVLEVGVYEGRSAIFLAKLLAPGERLVVCDLFGDVAPDGGNQAENQAQYPTLERRTFEENCRRHLGVQPVVYQCPSRELSRHLDAGRFRFVHLDGSHTYDVVRTDIETARALLGPGGVVAFDDYRSAHTPGVAAAAWGAVAAGTLSVLCATPSKLYAAFDHGASLDEIRAQLVTLDVVVEEESVAGRPLLRVMPRVVVPRGSKGLVRSLTPPIVWRLAGARAAAYRRRRLRQP